MTGTVWMSTDSGVSWTDNASTSISGLNWFSIASSADGSRLVAADYSGSIWTYS